MIKKPSLLQSVIQEERQTQSKHTQAPTRSSQRCTCRAFFKYKPYSPSRSYRSGDNSTPSLWNATTFSSRLVHRQDCLLFNNAQETKKLGLRVSFSGTLLQGAIEAALSMTRGYGGFSISPVLSFNIVVPSDTGPFKILGFCFNNGTFSAADMRATFEFKIRELVQLYQDRKASPGDIDENGNTIMHVSLPWIHTCPLTRR